MMKLLHQDIQDPKEKLFVKTIAEYAYKANIQNRGFFTEFHNSEWMKQTIQKYCSKVTDIRLSFFGGYEGAERQMLGVFPEYEVEEVFPIICLSIEVKTGIGKPLTHRDFLGALLGLGLERTTIGDIIIKSFGAYVFVKDTIGDYITFSLTGIGKYQHIEIRTIDFSELELEAPNVKEINTTVASLRADAVLAAAFPISRTACTKLMQNDKASCNGIIIPSNSLIKEGDVLTLRGYGKIKLKHINGITKKERLHICIEKYV